MKLRKNVKNTTQAGAELLKIIFGHNSFGHKKLRIGFDQKIRFESVGSKFESNSNPCFFYNLTVAADSLETFLPRFFFTFSPHVGAKNVYISC